MSTHRFAQQLNTRRGSRLWGPIAALALTLAGCASATDPEVGAAATPAETSGADDANDAASAAQDGEPTVNDAAKSPLAEAVGFDLDDRTELNNDYIRAAEASVRECMADAGFDYVPREIGFAPAFERQLELQSTLTEEQFVDQYGYGIATLYELNFQDRGVLLFVEQLLGPPPTGERTDSEQIAYELALNGETIQGLSAEDAQDAAFDTGTQPPGQGSCRQQGYDNATTPALETFNGLQSLLGDELEALDERFVNDSRVRELRSEWQTCMAAEGYTYERDEDAREEFQSLADDIGGRFQQAPETLAIFAQAIEVNLSALDEQARYDFLESTGALQGFALVPALQAELDELATRELAVARHSFDCTDHELTAAVRQELEEAFVEEHADQLALLRAEE